MRDLFEVERVVAPCSPAGEIFTANAGGKVIIGIGIHVAKIKLQRIDGPHWPIAKILIGRLAQRAGAVITVCYGVAGHRVIVAVFIDDIGRNIARRRAVCARRHAADPEKRLVNGRILDPQVEVAVGVSPAYVGYIPQATLVSRIFCPDVGSGEAWVEGAGGDEIFVIDIIVDKHIGVAAASAVAGGERHSRRGQQPAGQQHDALGFNRHS